MKRFLLKIHVYEIPQITVAFLKQANTKGKIPEPGGIVLGWSSPTSRPHKYMYSLFHVSLCFEACQGILPIFEYSIHDIVFYSKTRLNTALTSSQPLPTSFPSFGWLTDFVCWAQPAQKASSCVRAKNMVTGSSNRWRWGSHCCAYCWSSRQKQPFCLWRNRST